MDLDDGRTRMTEPLGKQTDWVQKLASGGEAGWIEFLSSFSRMIYKVFCAPSLGFSRVEVEELFHDFLLSILEKNLKKVRLFEGRNNCSFGSYLKKIAINMAIDRKKRLIRIRAASLDRPLDGRDGEEGSTLLDLLNGPAPTPEKELMTREERVRFLDALFRLPPRHLVVVMLIVYHDFDRVAMARLLKTSRANVDVMYNRSKEQLRRLLGGPGRPVHGRAPEAEEDLPWKPEVARLGERMLFMDRDRLLQRCVEALPPPKELLAGLAFVNAMALCPTPARLAAGLGCPEREVHAQVKRILFKLVPPAERKGAPDRGTGPRMEDPKETNSPG